MMLSRTKRAIMWALTILLTLIVLCWVFYVAYVDFAINDANIKSEQYQKVYQQWSGSAAEGDTISQYRLGEMHEKGLGVPQNPIEAHVWYSLSTKGGLDAANTALARLQARMQPEQIAEAERLFSSYANLLNNNARPTALVPNTNQPDTSQPNTSQFNSQLQDGLTQNTVAQDTMVQNVTTAGTGNSGQILAAVNSQVNSTLASTTDTSSANLNLTDTALPDVTVAETQVQPSTDAGTSNSQQPTAVGTVVVNATPEQTARALEQLSRNTSTVATPSPEPADATTTAVSPPPPAPAAAQNVAAADNSPSLSVCEAQQMLTQLGFNVGVIDGIFGGQTSSAISEYQRNYGLEVTGTIDRPFIASLLGLPWDGTAIRNYCVRIGA